MKCLDGDQQISSEKDKTTIFPFWEWHELSLCCAFENQYPSPFSMQQGPWENFHISNQSPTRITTLYSNQFLILPVIHIIQALHTVIGTRTAVDPVHVRRPPIEIPIANQRLITANPVRDLVSTV